jgi:ribosomal protein S18 acetylase RimI-like enzyme
MDAEVIVRNVRSEDFPGIQSLSQKVYPFSRPWRIDQLESHQRVFPEGQFVAIHPKQGVVGLCFSLIVLWDDYSSQDTWTDFTDLGMFTNHDPENGRTLYGAEVMVDPELRGQHIGKKLYEARRELTQSLGLLRIRAGARLRGYSAHANKMSATEYTFQVVQKKLFDPTLSFQLKQGFSVIGIVKGYLGNDPESLGYAALIEWLNPKVAGKADLENQRKHFEATFSEARLP